MEIIFNFSASIDECIQRKVGILGPFITTYGLTCNNKPSCSISPLKLALTDCGNQQGSYLHVDFVCKSIIRN